MSQSIPWVGHSGKLRKRRRIRKRDKVESAPTNPEVAGSSTLTQDNSGIRTTRSGHQVKPPARFLYLNGNEVHSQNEGEVVRPEVIIKKKQSHEESRVLEHAVEDGR